jgi:cephalosporin hydroxylase
MTIEKLIDYGYKIGMAQERAEIEKLAEFLQDHNLTNAIEIGTKQGGVFHILNQIIAGKVISVDLVGGDFGGWATKFHPYLGDVHRKRDEYFTDKFPYAHFINGNSHDQSIIDEVTKHLDGVMVDFLFIDGDHTYEGVKQDYENYKQFVNVGGYIAFHDINDTDYHRKRGVNVAQLWDELDGDKIEFNAHTHWAGIGVLKNES